MTGATCLDRCRRQRPSKTGFCLATKASTAVRWSRGRAGERHHLALEGQRRRRSRARRSRRPSGGSRRTPPSGPAASRPASVADLVGELVGRAPRVGGQPELEAPRRPGWCAGSRAARAPWPGPTSRGSVHDEPVSQDSAMPAEREVEAGGVGQHPEVAGEREARAGPGRDAVDRGDHRLRHRRQRGDDRVVVLGRRCGTARRASRPARIVDVLLEVLARRRTPARCR